MFNIALGNFLLQVSVHAAFHTSLVFSSYHFVFMGGARAFMLMFSYFLHVISFASMVVGSIWLNLAFKNK